MVQEDIDRSSELVTNVILRNIDRMNFLCLNLLEHSMIMKLRNLKLFLLLTTHGILVFTSSALQGMELRFVKTQHTILLDTPQCLLLIAFIGVPNNH